MPEQFYFVEALEDACWRSERQMVVALVDARWRIDTGPVDVLPNVVYSFAREDDAAYLMTCHESERFGQPRAVPVFVTKGQLVTFWREADANFFVAKGRARRVSDAEIQAMVAAAQSAAGAADPVHDHAADDEHDAAPAAAPASPEHVAVKKAARKRG